MNHLEWAKKTYDILFAIGSDVSTVIAKRFCDDLIKSIEIVSEEKQDLIDSYEEDIEELEKYRESYEKHVLAQGLLEKELEASQKLLIEVGNRLSEYEKRQQSGYMATSPVISISDNLKPIKPFPVSEATTEELEQLKFDTSGSEVDFPRVNPEESVEVKTPKKKGRPKKISLAQPIEEVSEKSIEDEKIPLEQFIPGSNINLKGQFGKEILTDSKIVGIGKDFIICDDPNAPVKADKKNTIKLLDVLSKTLFKKDNAANEQINETISTPVKIESGLKSLPLVKQQEAITKALILKLAVSFKDPNIKKYMNQFHTLEGNIEINLGKMLESYNFGVGEKIETQMIAIGRGRTLAFTHHNSIEGENSIFSFGLRDRNGQLNPENIFPLVKTCYLHKALAFEDSADPLYYSKKITAALKKGLRDNDIELPIIKVNHTEFWLLPTVQEIIKIREELYK